MTKDLLETSKTTDFLIESLPGIDKTEEQQIRELEVLEARNQELEKELRVWIDNARNELSIVNTDLERLSERQLERLSLSTTKSQTEEHIM